MVNFISRALHKVTFIFPGGYSLRPFIHRLRGVKIGKNVWISQMVYLDELHPEAISIGDNSSIGLRTSVFTHFYWGEKKKNKYKKVIIDKNVFIGPHCLILPNVHIGEGAVIKGGTVISRDVPPFTFWGLPNAGPLAKITVPLTWEHSYGDFVKGLRPMKNKKPNMNNK